MKKNVFPFLFIAAVAINTLISLINNYTMSLAYASESRGYGWILLSGLILAVSAFFLIKGKNLKLCVIFLLLSAILNVAFNYSSDASMISAFYPTNDVPVSEMFSGTKEDYFVSKVTFDAIKGSVTILRLSSLVPSIVLSAAILLIKNKKIFTALTIVASVVALFSSGIFYALAILFAGLSIRMDFEEL